MGYWEGVGIRGVASRLVWVNVVLRGFYEEVRFKVGARELKSGYVGFVNDDNVYVYYSKCDASFWKV